MKNHIVILFISAAKVVYQTAKSCQWIKKNANKLVFYGVVGGIISQELSNQSLCQVSQ